MVTHSDRDQNHIGLKSLKCRSQYIFTHKDNVMQETTSIVNVLDSILLEMRI